MAMRRTLAAVGITAVGLLVIVFSVWAAGAFWYRLPGPHWLKTGAALMMAFFGASVAAAMATRHRWRALAGHTVVALSVLLWWSTIRPAAVADFAPDVALQATGEVVGELLTLRNVRDFAWRSDTDFIEKWDERSYDLRQLRSLDLFLSRWDDTGIAHMIMSFGFADGRYLAWSVEVRRLRGSIYSPIASAFKENTLVLIASDERDVIGVRTNIRNERVDRYRLNLRPETIRRTLLEFVAYANALAERPAFYNSLTTNCTTAVVAMMRAVGATVPLDWRLLMNSRLPEYAFDHDALEEGLTLEQAKALAPVTEKARAFGLGEGFSTAIRQR